MPDKPGGTPRKLVHTKPAERLGLEAVDRLKEGLASAYADFKKRWEAGAIARREIAT